MATSKKQTVKVRYRWADLAKVFGIFGVVYIHSGGYLSSYFRFGVPVFIAISFFLIEKSTLMKRTFMVKDFLGKRLLRLAIPYLFWSFLYLLLDHPFADKSILKFLSTHCIGFGWSGQYYLLILALLTLLYPLFRLIKSDNVLLVSLLILTLLCYLFFNYLSLSKLVSKLHELFLVYWVFYAYLGIYAGRNYDLLKCSLQKVKVFYRFILLALLPFAMTIEDILLQNSGFAKESYFRVSTIIVSTLVFLLLLSLEEFLIRKEVNGFNIIVNWLSAWTLGIYCLNPLVIKMMRHFQLIVVTNYSPFIIKLILSISNCLIICFIALVISILINQLKGAILVK